MWPRRPVAPCPRPAAPRRAGSCALAAAALGAVLVLAVAPRARGQLTRPEDPAAVAQARALFEQGLAAADQHDWTTAVDLFSRSMAVRRSPSVAFNLGLALVQVGRRVEARDALLFARDRSADPSVRERARVAAAAVEAQLGRLELRLGSPLAGAELRLDGQAVEPLPPGVPRFVDPGGHVLAVVRAGREVDWAAVEVPPGRMLVVALDPSRAVPPPPRAEAPGAAVDPRSVRADRDADDGGLLRRRERHAEPPSLLERWWFWTAVGVVVVGATTAGIVAASSGSEEPFRGNLGPGTIEIP